MTGRLNGQNSVREKIKIACQFEQFPFQQVYTAVAEHRAVSCRKSQHFGAETPEAFLERGWILKFVYRTAD
jgi:hypothetical protein